MARRKNYSSEQLKKYVDEYVRQKNDYSVITATALAEYCNAALHLLPSVTYQNFTRDKEVMKYIDHINSELHERMLIPSTKGASAFTDGFYIEETADVEEVRKKAYEELEKREDLIRELQSEYNKCSKELASIRQEREALLDINKSLRDTVTDQKKEIALLNKQVKEGKTLLAAFRSYFKDCLYDPIVVRRVSQKGWVSDKRDAVKRCAVDADIISEIDSFYESSGNYEREILDNKTTESPSTSSFGDAHADVVDSASAAFLSKLRNL